MQKNLNFFRNETINGRKLGLILL